MTTLAEALAVKSDQLNADDLMPGPRTLKITTARIVKEGRDTKIILGYEGDQGKPWKPCKTMGRAMVMVWAVTDETQFVGKSVRVYRDPTVRFGDQGEVGGIRISHMSHIEKPTPVKLTVSQGKKSVFTFHPLLTDVPRSDSAGTESKAEKWARQYVSKVDGLATISDLAEYEASKATLLEELRATRPDLHDSVSNAVRLRFEHLTATAGGSFDDDDAESVA